VFVSYLNNRNELIEYITVKYRGSKMHLEFNEYIDDLQPTLMGYFILNKFFSEHFIIEVPYPPTELSEKELETIKDKFNALIPLDSFIVDLWDWDLHFENELSNDWYFEAVFGRKSNIHVAAEELANYFMEKSKEHSIDYNQSQYSPEEYYAHVLNESLQFIINWRKNIQDTLTS